MNYPDGTSNHPDSGTCLTMTKYPSIGQEFLNLNKIDSDNLDRLWYPRVVSSYGLTESAHWSRRLNEDASASDGIVPTVSYTATTVERNFYSHEDANAAYLERKPVTFAIFGKPGLPADSLADALSAYWGCVHVSVARRLASGHTDFCTAAALRAGHAVTAARTTAQLIALLGLRNSPEIRERGYVLTGLPRHDPVLGVDAQIDAIFATNPPDVLIYMSCPDRDLHVYRSGLALETAKHGGLTQTLHPKNETMRNERRYAMKWYASFRARVVAEQDLEDYLSHSLAALERIVKQFDPDHVITVDGRSPVDEMMDTVKAKLLTMAVQRTVRPEIVNEPDKSVSSEDYADLNEIHETAEHGDGDGAGTEEVIVEEVNEQDQVNGEHGDGNGNGTTAVERNEWTRLKSEYGRLCPVNFSYGKYRLGVDRYCAKFMGKLYFFAGFEEMQLFNAYPREFLKPFKPELPVRAIFYGPNKLSDIAAKAVNNFFNFNVIDVSYIKHMYEEEKNHAYVGALVKSVLNTAKDMMTKTEEDQSSDVRVLKNAIDDWIRLNFDSAIEIDFRGTEGDGSEQESIFEDNNSNQRALYKKRDKEAELLRLRDLFDLYGLDFIDDLDACVHAYNEPVTLIKYIQNISKKNRKRYRLSFLKENETTQLEFINMIVNYVRIRNVENKNWIIVNAPLDVLLVKKLIAADLNPIQMVFFHDKDPLHKILLSEKIINAERTKLISKTFKNVKDGIRRESITKRIDYSEFVKKIERSSNDDIYIEETDFLYDGYENEEHNEHIENYDHIIDHEQLMEFILPVITERLNLYTKDLFKQWHYLKIHILKEMDQYMDFHIIECHPDSTTNMVQLLVEDTLFYIKKFISDYIYDASLKDQDESKPIVGKYDGDTSIYCPVNFANGKFSIGSKKHMAIYQNRYYYMSSTKNLKKFISNPNKYSSFVNPPKLPKPKISILLPFGLKSLDMIHNLLKKFDLTLVDSYTIFKNNILPKNIPMVGKMYEEPTLEKIMNQYFISHHNIDYINSLRNYIDGDSSYLNDKNWWKLNSVYFQTDEGICYKNYPRNLLELKYLKENEIHPDVIIEIIPDKNEGNTQAKRAAIKNWLNYQYELVDKVIAHDDKTRRNIINKRSIMFKKSLTAMMEEKINDEIKTRLKRIINMIVTETTEEPDTMEHICDKTSHQNDLSAKTFNNKCINVLSSSNIFSRYSELTLKQKLIIINYGLDIKDFYGLNDFTILEKIEEIVLNKLPEPEILISKCFSENLTFPSDTIIEQYLKSERSVFESMRKFAESSNIPWKTISSKNHNSTILNNIANYLVDSRNVIETTFNMDLYTSDDMLRSGQVYLSKFGRWCPVQVYEDPNLMQPLYSEDGVCPVVYRKYLYYISGPKNRDKFRQQPLKYVNRSFSRPPDFSIKIAVLGPPNSGKSHCARELCDRYGFQLIQIEKYIKSYLTTYKWIDDVKSSISTLYRGDALSDITLVEIVKWAMQTTRAAVQGFVLDGFPITDRQFQLFDESGIVLHKVFVMDELYQLPKTRQYECCSLISIALLRHKCRMWTDAFVGITWISQRYGNATMVTRAHNSYDQMEMSLRQCIASLRQYRRNMHDNIPVRLADVPVTNHERSDRMSMYLDMCPVCRLDDGCLERPQDEKSLRKNLVQCKYRFYWICPQHWTAFSVDYQKYVDSAPEEPEYIPNAVTVEDVSNNPYGRDRNVSEFCVVCALSRIWNPVYRRGKSTLMMTYLRFTFALCSPECQLEFSRRPFFYCKYQMHVTGPETPSSSSPENLVINQLPVLGYLEQTIAKSVSSALVDLTAAKPLFPGLSAHVSAMVFLGLSIGINGTNDDDLREYYQNVFQQLMNTYTNFKIKVFNSKMLT